MSADAPAAVQALHQRFFLDHPHEAAPELEAMDLEDAARMVAAVPLLAALRAWQALTADVAARMLVHLPADVARQLFTEAEPAFATNVLAQLDHDDRERTLKLLERDVATELRALLEYPADSAGRIMDPRVTPVRDSFNVGEALARLRAAGRNGLREMFVVDAHRTLTGRVEVQDLAVADESQPLADIVRPLAAVVSALDPREDVVAILQRQAITALPVVDAQHRLIGVIRQSGLMSAIEAEASVDIQTMVGVSPDERALSSPWFAVRKRLPWLQINLLTAFLASMVVGLFESTIAQFTALAVLLPVVAGQSGNSGAQALAVTMRGLVLREISPRQWPRVLAKELAAGLINGVAVAATTAAGVYAWSRSVGLVIVIVIAMIVSMIAAGLAGALVPIVLRRIGQDPATASSIILTTVTDVVGFFSFLGTATLFASKLA